MFSNVWSGMLEKQKHKPQYFAVICTGEIAEVLQSTWVLLSKKNGPAFKLFLIKSSSVWR